MSTMLVLIMLLVIKCIKTAIPIELYPGEAHQADVLDQLIRYHSINNNTDSNDDTKLNFYYGDNITTNKLNTNSFDSSILDTGNVHEMVEIAKKEYETSLRRQYPAHWEVLKEAYRPNPFFVNKAFDMMKQSIYATRYRLEQTRPFRVQFQIQVSYQIAVVYGSLTQLIYKMDNMLAQMQHFGHRTHFLWYLILYEKILAGHVDVTFMVHKMYNLQAKWSELSQDAGDGDGPHMMTPPPSNLGG